MSVTWKADKRVLEAYQEIVKRRLENAMTYDVLNDHSGRPMIPFRVRAEYDGRSLDDQERHLNQQSSVFPLSESTMLEKWPHSWQNPSMWEIICATQSLYVTPHT